MKTKSKSILLFMLAFILIIFLAAPTSVMAAEPTVDLGTTDSFAVLAGTTITNTGSSIISGDIGVSPGSSITGFPPGIVSDGTTHIADAVALQAQADLTIAYNDAAGRSVTDDLTGQDLGGMTLTTGVYSFSSSAQLTGTLTLDAEGDPEAVFIFQIGSTLTTASNSEISLINGARFCRVFWQVGSSATLGTNTSFVGHIFALTSITSENGTNVEGQLLARNGAVTLDSNTIDSGVCAAVTPAPTDTTAEETTSDVTAEETTADVTTVETTNETAAEGTTSENEEVPKTGESFNYLYQVIILLGLTGSLIYLSLRRHGNKQKR